MHQKSSNVLLYDYLINLINTYNDQIKPCDMFMICNYIDDCEQKKASPIDILYLLCIAKNAKLLSQQQPYECTISDGHNMLSKKISDKISNVYFCRRKDYMSKIIIFDNVCTTLEHYAYIYALLRIIINSATFDLHCYYYFFY
ncbi:hypothetical protein COBT_000137 [Conglomerata obtusa]